MQLLVFLYDSLPMVAFFSSLLTSQYCYNIKYYHRTMPERQKMTSVQLKVSPASFWA